MSCAVQDIIVPYTPRPWQRSFHSLMDAHRFVAVCCHRRGGKTVAMVNQLIKRNTTNTKPRPQSAYIAPTYKQAKQVAWDYMKQFTACIPGRKVNESELRIEMPHGGRLMCLGVENPDSIRGLYLDDVAGDEPREWQGRAWREVILPALADRKGRAALGGTAGGRGFWYDTFEHAKIDPDWGCATFRASETNALDAAELDTQRRNMSEDEYEQEYECSWSAGLRGSYYAKLIEKADQDGRICDVPYDPAMRVVTAWDLGVRDSTAIVFAQMANAQPRIIDYYEQTGEGLPHYAKHLQSLPYVYGDHIAPHDIEVRELGTGKSRKETAASLGLNFRTLPNMPLGDGIEAVRNFLPRVWIDRKKCAGLIDALSSYRAEVNPRTDELLPHPLHDWSEHGASAVRYLALGMVAQRAKTLPKVNTRWVV